MRYVCENETVAICEGLHKGLLTVYDGSNTVCSVFYDDYSFIHELGPAGLLLLYIDGSLIAKFRICSTDSLRIDSLCGVC